MGNSIAFSQTTGVKPKTTGVRGRYVTAREVRERLANVIEPYTDKSLALAADRTVDAARHWRAQNRTADTVSVLNLARGYPQVWQLIDEIVHEHRYDPSAAVYDFFDQRRRAS